MFGQLLSDLIEAGLPEVLHAEKFRLGSSRKLSEAVDSKHLKSLSRPDGEIENRDRHSKRLLGDSAGDELLDVLRTEAGSTRSDPMCSMLSELL